jgi:hypothetical protein
MIIQQKHFDAWADLVNQKLFHVSEPDLDDTHHINQLIVLQMIFNNPFVLQFKTLKELLEMFNVLE